jgi:hypothetical protein
MAYKQNLEGWKLNAAVDEFAEVSHYRKPNRINDSLIKKRKFEHNVMYFSTPILVRCVLKICRYR